MKNSKNKKSAKEKKIFIASILLAAMITVGGTFAWFTSKDEVTNKLSASNNYGVSITETFTPPTSWVPGQDVEKKVGVLNTGNIDAFVKLSLSNELVLTTLNASGTAIETITADTDFSKFVELNAAEVTALQAGGALVWEAGSAPDDENVGTGYTPQSTGLYVFRRVIDSTQGEDGAITYTYEYAGYYYDSTIQKYYAIQDIVKNESDSSFTAALQTTETALYGDDDVVLDYTHAVASEEAPYITATYGTGDKQIIINIKLDKTELAKWTLLPAVSGDSNPGPHSFYYNSVLKSGESSGNLVTAVEIDDSVKEEAYLNFDYNLTVTAESVQVVESDDKNDAVIAEWTDVEVTINENGLSWAARP